jgi:3-oxoacyl-[acyl-carrier-protein] synthase-3
MDNVFLRSVGTHLPDNVYTNRELCELLHFPLHKGEKYGHLLGVWQRPVCVDYRAGGRQVITGEELAHRAAQRALDRAGLEPGEIDAIVACSSFFDYVAPPVSSRLLKLLGMRHAMTFDLIGGCAEFLHGLVVAANMIRIGQAREVLVTSSEVISAWWRQGRYPIEYFIFGDTGGAMVLSSSTGSHRLASAHLDTRSTVNGEPAELICVPIMGGKEPAPLYYDNPHVDPLMAPTSDIPARYRLVHNVKQVAMGAPQAMIEATGIVLREGDVDPKATFLVPHQASIGVISALTETGVPERQIGNCLADHGNMSTSSLPVTLDAHWDAAMQYPNLVLTSVGVGISFGAALFERLGEPGGCPEQPEIGDVQRT